MYAVAATARPTLQNPHGGEISTLTTAATTTLTIAAITAAPVAVDEPSVATVRETRQGQSRRHGRSVHGPPGGQATPL